MRVGETVRHHKCSQTLTSRLLQIYGQLNSRDEYTGSLDMLEAISGLKRPEEVLSNVFNDSRD